jgi:hypothetical protein
MRELCDEVVIERHPDGTTVSMRRALVTSPAGAEPVIR